MKKRLKIKIALYSLGAIAILISAGIWVFLSYYYEGTLNRVVIPQIQQAARDATDGRYALKLGKIAYSNGTLVCDSFILSRVGYDSSEHGMGLYRLVIDSARFEGIRWWDVLLGKSLKLVSLHLNDPKLYVIDIDSDHALPHNLRFDKSKKTPAESLIVPVISFDSIVLRDICVFLRNLPQKAIEPAYRNITVKLTDFSLDLNRALPQLPLFSQHIDFEIPGGRYPIGDSMYSLVVRGIKGSVADSLVTLDTIEYLPKYNDDEFAEKNKYLRGRLEVRLTGISIRGVDFVKCFRKGAFDARSLTASSWYVSYYGDRRKPHDPYPPDALMPNDLIASVRERITIDSVILDNGFIKHQERVTGSTHPSLITLTEAHAVTVPFCTDVSNSLYSEPFRITVNGLFMRQGKISASIVYPIHHKTLDLHAEATMGPFDLPVLNSYLVTNERKEITSGRFLSGELRLDIRSGRATTIVSPHYSDAAIKLLPDGSKDKGGIIEDIKSFIANAVVLRKNNIDQDGQKAVSIETTTTRSSKEEFFQFIWIALHKSIMKVVGL